MLIAPSFPATSSVTDDAPLKTNGLLIVPFNSPEHPLASVIEIVYGPAAKPENVFVDCVVIQPSMLY